MFAPFVVGAIHESPAYVRYVCINLSRKKHIRHTPIHLDKILKLRAMRHKGGESPLRHTNIICQTRKSRRLAEDFWSATDMFVQINIVGCEAISPHRQVEKDSVV